MASRAVVFRPINKDDVSITPFEANTVFRTDETSYLTDGYVVRHGIHNVQTTPISASNLDADNARNPDGTYQTPTWKAIDHLFYRPETKNVPMHTMEHYNPVKDTCTDVFLIFSPCLTYGIATTLHE